MIAIVLYILIACNKNIAPLRLESYALITQRNIIPKKEGFFSCFSTQASTSAINSTLPLLLLRAINIKGVKLLLLLFSLLVSAAVLGRVLIYDGALFEFSNFMYSWYRGVQRKWISNSFQVKNSWLIWKSQQRSSVLSLPLFCKLAFIEGFWWRWLNSSKGQIYLNRISKCIVIC